MNGGPKCGSGRPPIEDRDRVRSRGVRVSFRPGKFEDLQAIARGWGVPVAKAVWAVVLDQLARFRKRAPEFGEHGLGIAAGSPGRRRYELPIPSERLLGLSRGDDLRYDPDLTWSGIQSAHTDHLRRAQHSGEELGSRRTHFQKIDEEPKCQPISGPSGRPDRHAVFCKLPFAGGSIEELQERGSALARGFDASHILEGDRQRWRFERRRPKRRELLGAHSLSGQ